MSPSLLFLTGEYEHKLDGKNRLFIPGKLRDHIYPDRDGLGFYLVLGRNKILCLYPDEYYRRLASEAGGGLVPAGGAVDFERVNFALATHVDLDQHFRISLPPRMLERAGLDKDVALIGAKDHIEIWDAKVWAGYLQEQLEQFEEVLTRFIALEKPSLIHVPIGEVPSIWDLVKRPPSQGRAS